MLTAKFVPIDTWPGKKTILHGDSRFRARYIETLDLLERELDKILATDILIQLYLEKGQIKNNGWPRADSRPYKPGVILTFEKKRKTISMPCDKFNHWHDNLRAIALSLEALRKVDRYGVTQSGEQYKGWEALPKPESNGEFDAREVIKRFAGFAPSDDNVRSWQNTIRVAELNTHPDKGGIAEEFALVQRAKKELNL